MNGTAFRLLVTSAGRRVGLIECFRGAASRMGVSLEVHACDAAPLLSAACATADHAFAVPRCDDAAYAPTLAEYCRTRGIGLLVPTIDPELAPLARHRALFEEAGSFVHVSSAEVIDIVRDKVRTVEVLGAGNVPIPRTARLEEVRGELDGWQWPLFIKPVAGSASRNIELLHEPAGLKCDYAEAMLVQEYLRGDEYTVTVYVTEDGTMAAAIGHLRISVRAGEVEKGRTVRSSRIHDIARNVVAALPGARGVLCFQLIEDPVLGPRVFEVNARFGGGYPLADFAGCRFAESLLSEALGAPPCASNDWREGAEMLRYDAAVFR